MTELQKRMIECLQLRGLSPRTQKAYLRAVRQLAEHYHKSPALITEAELRQYFLFLKNVKHYSRPSMTIVICGIKFCFEKTHSNVCFAPRPAQRNSTRLVAP